MSLYYMKGAGLGLSLFDESKDHFMHELNNVKEEADAIAYIYNVLIADEKIGGVHGRHIERNIKPKGILNILKDREVIIGRFKSGELAYTETPLGACLTTQPCDKKALRAVSACISCDKAVIKLTNLLSVIDKTQSFVDLLSPNSIEYQFESQQLDDLKRLKNDLECKLCPVS